MAELKREEKKPGEDNKSCADTAREAGFIVEERNGSEKVSAPAPIVPAEELKKSSEPAGISTPPPKPRTDPDLPSSEARGGTTELIRKAEEVARKPLPSPKPFDVAPSTHLALSSPAKSDSRSVSRPEDEEVEEEEEGSEAKEEEKAAKKKEPEDLLKMCQYFYKEGAEIRAAYTRKEAKDNPVPQWEHDFCKRLDQLEAETKTIHAAANGIVASHSEIQNKSHTADGLENRIATMRSKLAKMGEIVAVPVAQIDPGLFTVQRERLATLQQWHEQAKKRQDAREELLHWPVPSLDADEVPELIARHGRDLATENETHDLDVKRYKEKTKALLQEQAGLGAIEMDLIKEIAEQNKANAPLVGVNVDDLQQKLEVLRGENAKLLREKQNLTSRASTAASHLAEITERIEHANASERKAVEESRRVYEKACANLTLTLDETEKRRDDLLSRNKELRNRMSQLQSECDRRSADRKSLDSTNLQKGTSVKSASTAIATSSTMAAKFDEEIAATKQQLRDLAEREHVLRQFQQELNALDTEQYLASLTVPPRVPRKVQPPRVMAEKTMKIQREIAETRKALAEARRKNETLQQSWNSVHGKRGFANRKRLALDCAAAKVQMGENNRMAEREGQQKRKIECEVRRVAEQYRKTARMEWVGVMLAGVALGIVLIAIVLNFSK